jgi:hypothetical protein
MNTSRLWIYFTAFLVVFFTGIATGYQTRPMIDDLIDTSITTTTTTTTTTPTTSPIEESSYEKAIKTTMKTAAVQAQCRDFAVMVYTLSEQKRLSLEAVKMRDTNAQASKRVKDRYTPSSYYESPANFAAGVALDSAVACFGGESDSESCYSTSTK